MYVEFIARDPAMPVEIFHALGGQGAWRDSRDPLYGQITRTAGLGPHPCSIAFCEFTSMKRMDEWEAHFRSAQHQADKGMHAKHQAIHHYVAGCYDELMPSSRLTGGLYLVDFCRLGAGDPARQIAAWQAARADLTLHLAIARIGLLGPDPGALLVWGAPSLAALGPLLNPGLPTGPLVPACQGIYRDFGRGDP